MVPLFRVVFEDCPDPVVWVMGCCPLRTAGVLCCGPPGCCPLCRVLSSRTATIEEINIFFKNRKLNYYYKDIYDILTSRIWIF